MTDALYFPGLMPSPFEELEAFLIGSEHATNRLREASDALGYDLLDAFRAASAYHTRELGRRDWMVHACAQMAISLALADWVNESNAADPAVCGGHSLGTWVAGVYADALSWADALRMTHASGRIESEYFDSLPAPLGSLVLFLPPGHGITELLAEFPTDPPLGLEVSVVFDAGVYGVAGPVLLLDSLAERVQQLGGRPLYASNRVEHCTVARPVRDALAVEVATYDWRDPRIPVLSDVDGSMITSGTALRDDLLDAIVTTVRWERTVAGLHSAGTDVVHVIGTNNKNIFSRVLADDFTVVSVTPNVVLGRSSLSRS